MTGQRGPVVREERRCREAGGHPRRPTADLARLEYQDVVVGGEFAGDRTPGRPCPDDDHVVRPIV